jgi:plasmid stabilization system protein ParE
VKHSVRFKRPARFWVRREIEYLEENHPAAASRFIAAIERATLQLSEHPLSEPPGNLPDTRRLVVGDYIVSYRIRRGTVEVFAVRHGRQRDARAPVG